MIKFELHAHTNECDPYAKLCGKDLWFDLSFGYGLMGKHIAQAIVDRHTPDRLLFASDMPWQRPSWQLRLLDTLEMTGEQREAICWRNATKLLES